MRRSAVKKTTQAAVQLSTSVHSDRTPLVPCATLSTHSMLAHSGSALTDARCRVRALTREPSARRTCRLSGVKLTKIEPTLHERRQHAERRREEPGLQIDSGQNNVEARYIFAGLTENNDDRNRQMSLRGLQACTDMQSSSIVSLPSYP